MKKIIANLILLTFVLFTFLIVILSTTGVETEKFNKLISNKVSQTKNVYFDLEKIKFKINLKELNLFLETKNPKIAYRDLSVPVKNIKVYVNFLSLFK